METCNGKHNWLLVTQVKQEKQNITDKTQNKTKVTNKQHCSKEDNWSKERTGQDAQMLATQEKTMEPWEDTHS